MELLKRTKGASSLDILSLQQEMAKILKPKRYLHVLGVQFTCASLAMKYHANIEKAQIAGMLHDCAKHLDDEMQLAECMKYGINISEVERKVPALLHSKLGAYYAKTIYGVEDEEILNAIIYHTTGRPNMALLEKILYVADYIEPSRPDIMRGLNEIRSMAFEDLDATIVMIARNTLDYVKSGKGEVDETSIETLNYYQKLLEQRTEVLK